MCIAGTMCFERMFAAKSLLLVVSSILKDAPNDTQDELEGVYQCSFGYVRYAFFEKLIV